MARRNLDKLSLIYDKRQKDFVVKYPNKADGCFVLNRLINEVLLWNLDKATKHEFFAFMPESFKDELEKRGYDLSTLKFSIELKS